MTENQHIEDGDHGSPSLDTGSRVGEGPAMTSDPTTSSGQTEETLAEQAINFPNLRREYAIEHGDECVDTLLALIDSWAEHTIEFPKLGRFDPEKPYRCVALGADGGWILVNAGYTFMGAKQVETGKAGYIRKVTVQVGSPAEQADLDAKVVPYLDSVSVKLVRDI